MNTTKTHALILDFIAALNSRMAKITVVKGLAFKPDESGCYERTARLELFHPAFGEHADLMQVSLHVYSQKPSGDYLVVEYNSVRSGNGYRQVVVTGTAEQQANKIAKRAFIRYIDAVEKQEAHTQRLVAEEARLARWKADFTGPDGKFLIPRDFANSYRQPGEYSLDLDKSTVLQSNRWHREEVIELVELLRKVRKAMAADGRINPSERKLRFSVDR